MKLRVHVGLERLVLEVGLVSEVGEVEPGEIAAELVGGSVVGQGGLFGGVEGAEPKPGTVLRETDLGDPFAPMTLPHSSIELGGFRRRADLLHRDGFGTEIAMLLGLELDLSLDLVDLSWG